jgi:TolB protein
MSTSAALSHLGPTVAAAVLLVGYAAGCSNGTEVRMPPAATPKLSLSAPGRVTGWLAYQTTDGALDRVHLVRTDGSGDHPIAQGLSGRTAHPDFSRDGTRLAFDQLESEEGAVDQLYISDPDGEPPRLLARCVPPECLGQWEAAWSPNGRRLAISIGQGPLTDAGPTTNGLAIVDVATQKVTPILIHPATEGQDHFARWSPDGSALVFWRERNTPDGSIDTAIFRVEPTGRHLQQLTAWTLLAADPDWSPDGTTIVFATSPFLVFPQLGRSDLYVMEPDGTGVRQITHNGPNGPRAAGPRWAPDGKTILYVHAGSAGFPRHVYSVRPDGTGDTPLLTTRDIYTHPVLRPTT